MTAIAIAVTLVAIVTPALVVLLARDDRSIGDIALIELRTRDVLSRDPPLSGVYSRYGWSHPGPLMYYVYAIPYRLFGGDADALRMTALLVNVLVLGALAWLVRRRGRAATVAILGATAALVWGMLPHSLTDGWNVTIAILPMMLALVGCWCALCKDRFGLAVAAVSTAFVFQAHIGFGVVVVPVFLATVVWAAIDASRSSERDRLRRVALVGGGCLLLFGPVLYDMVDRWPGNLGRIVKWSVTNDEQKIGAGNALRLIGRTASLSFPFHPPFPGGFLLSIDNVTVGVVPGALLIALVAAFVVAIRRGWRDVEVALRHGRRYVGRRPCRRDDAHSAARTMVDRMVAATRLDHVRGDRTGDVAGHPSCVLDASTVVPGPDCCHFRRAHRIDRRDGRVRPFRAECRLPGGRRA